MYIWTTVFLITTLGALALGSIIRHRRQEGRRIPEVFERQAREELNLPEPSTLPTVNARFQACLINRKRGFCRYTQFCPLEEYLRNYETFFRNTCIVEGSRLGVCCPYSYDSSDTMRNPTSRRPVTSNPLSNKECGVVFKPRIVGGQNATAKDWTWMAALLRNGTNPYCGGVLINSRYVLTAAHCTSTYRSSQIKVRIGEYDFSVDTDGQHEDFDVEEIKAHQGFRSTSGRDINDICLVKLSKEVSFGGTTRPVCLPSLGTNYVNKVGKVAGWGTSENGRSGTKVLKEVEVSIWTWSDCRNAYQIEILDSEFCAGYKAGGRDACQGDSGGPLIVSDPQGRYSVVGIVAWGLGSQCGRPGTPGVYTNVQSFLGWIQENST